ncbi:cell differentiation protein rcd1 [Kwoniella dejecticola CBS 10117]|uniref:Cell differentiation protein rcd1 n=1 Tax=Kwoniella dejecticola CBS 10117 TaxID=1296121 RepID=A0A1A5ZUA6_9TREE|nr:cell differentiation protein rcd1 [Kwoniella dejecticola CBS 10117]OBR81392.1 cell differentiation protein rcd1 [Kwoniella dejecticola CBS 10117]
MYAPHAPPHFQSHLQHRPPTNPPTPDTDAPPSWSSGHPPPGVGVGVGVNLGLSQPSSSGPGGFLSLPPSNGGPGFLFAGGGAGDGRRSNQYPFSATSGGNSPLDGPGPGPGQGQGLGSSNNNGGIPNRNAHTHTPQLSLSNATNPNGTSTTPIPLPGTTSSSGVGGGGGGGGPLLPQNLAQHLNNPPAPTHAQNSSSAQSQNQNQNQGSGTNNVSGKVLLMPNGAPPPAGSDEEKIYILITELLEPETREGALLELSKKRELYEDLALVLWGGYGIMSSLLLEIVAVYPALSPPSLTAHASNRVCNALALLQCVASHSDTRALFLNAHIPLFLYPFLNTTSKTRPFEYLRLTSLGVIGALVKQNENSDVINFLLSTEIIPLCLRIMETGSELSKTVAIFIVQKILADDLGLQYICQTYERFYAVGAVLSNMVDALVESQAVRLLKHVVRCYLRMSDNPRAREALRACLPKALQDNTFTPLLKGDMVTKRCLTTLLMNLNDRTEG